MKYLIAVYICTYSMLGICQDLEFANQAMQSKDYLKALEIYNTCYKADTTQIDCLYNSATAASKSGDNTLAKEQFLTLERKDTFVVQAWQNLASLYEEEENPPKAIKYYTLLQSKFPDLPSYARKLGRLYTVADSYSDAWKYYSIAYQINPRDLKTVKGLAELAMSNKQTNLADSILLQGLQIDSTHIGLSLLRSKLKYKEQDYEQTAQILKGVLGRYDFNTYYHKLYGYSLVQIDSTQKAIYHLTYALQNSPRDEKLHYYLGKAYEDAGDIESAIFYYQNATEMSIDPSIDKYYRNLARLYDEEKDLPKAIAAYKEAYRYGKDPKIIYYLARASDIYYKDKSIAIKYYSKYLKSNDDTKSYKDYARERSRYLKELSHQMK